jgi:hypothetical protein
MIDDREFEMLGVMVPKNDKEAIKEIADRNRITISDVARLLLRDSLEHISERDILKLTSR